MSQLPEWKKKQLDGKVPVDTTNVRSYPKNSRIKLLREVAVILISVAIAYFLVGGCNG